MSEKVIIGRYDGLADLTMVIEVDRKDAIKAYELIDEG